jgi:hypothetical protein
MDLFGALIAVVDSDVLEAPLQPLCIRHMLVALHMKGYSRAYSRQSNQSQHPTRCSLCRGKSGCQAGGGAHQKKLSELASKLAGEADSGEDCVV